MPLIVVVLIGFLILTPFALGAMILTRNRKTRERLLSQATREIRSPGIHSGCIEMLSPATV